ncbi:MAG: ABC transporter substrate-binding protein [Limnochordaceae bacterium]|nr:ABC transporter substrate-binding protein [Limnochordaceae bacterium]
MRARRASVGQAVAWGVVAALVLLGVASSVMAAPTKLVYWHGWGGDEKKVVEDVVAQFNKTHPNIVVEPVTIFGAYDKLLTSIAAGTPPDVVSAIWWTQVADLASRGALVPLSSYAKKDGIKGEEYVAPVWEAVHYQGELYAMPVVANYSMIAYNKDHFKEAGLPDRAPKTTAELEEWAHKLYQVSRGRIQRIGYLPSDIVLSTYMFNGSVYDAKRRVPTPDAPEVIQAARWMRSFYAKYGYPALRAFQESLGSYASPENPFFSGKISIQDNWGEWIVNFTKWYAPDFHYGRFPYPRVDGSPGFGNWGGSVWGIPKGSKHPQEAWEFIKWLSAGDGNRLLALGISNASARMALNESPEFLEKMPVLKDALPLLREGRFLTSPIFPGNDEYIQKLTPVIDSILAGERDAEQALKEFAAQQK